MPRPLPLLTLLAASLAACVPQPADPGHDHHGHDHGRPGHDHAEDERPAGQWSPVERYDLAEELWGIEAPMIEGPPALAWDGATETLWATRGGSGRIVAVDLEEGPQRVVDLDGDSDEAALFVDEERRYLVWVGFPEQEVRVADLDSGEILLAHDPADQGVGRDEAEYAHRRAAYDETNGWLWMADVTRRGVRGMDAANGDWATVPVVERPVALDAGPDGRVWIIEALGRDEVRLVVYDPADVSVKEVKRVSVPHWDDGPPAHVLAHDDGTISVVGFQGATLGEDYTPEWWDTLEEESSVLSLCGAQEWTSLLVSDDSFGDPLLAVVDKTSGDVDTLWLPGFSTAVSCIGETAVALFGPHGVVETWSPTALVPVGATPIGVSADALDIRGGELRVTSYELGFHISIAAGVVELSTAVASPNPDSPGHFIAEMAGGRGYLFKPHAGDISHSGPEVDDLYWETILPRAASTRAEVAFDDGLGRLLVADTDGMVYGLALADGEIVASRDLGPLPARAGGYYDQGNLLIDPDGRRVFMGPRVLDSSTYELIRTLDNVQRVVWVGPDWALGTMVESTGAEWLVQLDPVTLATIESWPLGVSQGRRMAVAYDRENGLFWAAEPLEARVTAWPFPP